MAAVATASHALQMVIVEPETIQSTEPYIVTGELRVWGDVREERKDGLVWEFEDCENETARWIGIPIDRADVGVY